MHESRRGAAAQRCRVRVLFIYDSHWTRTGVTNDLSAFDAGAAAAAVAVTPPALDAWDGRRHAAIFRCYYSKTRRHKRFNM